MSSSASSTPFVLGAYIGNPDNSSTVNQAVYDAKFESFTTLMGQAPQMLITFIDQTQAVSRWVGNSMWAASSAKASGASAAMTPVIALPLSSSVSGSGSPDVQFKAFASGQYDDVLRGIVKAWTDQGFTNLIFRPGWEMNLVGPTYAGDDLASQADWVKAFQHVTTILRDSVAANGATAQIVWNPGVTNYSNAEATTNLYPGNAYVDVVGADVYSDIYPYSDGGVTPAYHDWDTGGTDTTVTQFIADAVNRMHYWSNPAATKWSLDGSSGHSQSLTSLIQFAQNQGKAFAIPETGAGNSNAGHAVQDDAAFPQWLAQQLTAAKAAGTTISFVGLWDSNGGGNYEFSSSTSGKPLEATAWAKYFGTMTTPTLTVGTGKDVLQMKVSEDAWQGDAQFTIAIDGATIGGILTVIGSHSAGHFQTIDILGSFGNGTHSAAVTFLNDAYGGTAATDRNLYVGKASLNGVDVPNADLSLMSSGTKGFLFSGPNTSTALVSNTLDVKLSEDAWQGDAQFTIAIDGATIGGIRTATASHAVGETQNVALSGNWGSGAHKVEIAFLNDAYGGSVTADRNLYVDAVTYDGRIAPGSTKALLSNGSAGFTTPGAPVNAIIAVQMSEDAWKGDAQYSVSIDGGSPVTTGSISALESLANTQTVSFAAMLAYGKHDIAISFLNDAYGGTSQLDRNLYVKGMSVNNSSVAGATSQLYSTGTSHFTVDVPII